MHPTDALQPQLRPIMTASTSPEEHRRAAKQTLSFVVVTISDSRTIENDKSGQLIVDSMQEVGHHLVSRSIVRDEPRDIRTSVEAAVGMDVDVILLTGGTGLAPRDQTPEAVLPMLDVEIPGFGELFRWLSFEEIGPAAMLSRAFGGRIGQTLIFCLPGSTAAVRLAMHKLLQPELPHLVFHARG